MSSIFEELNDLVSENPVGRVLGITLLILVFAGAVASLYSILAITIGGISFSVRVVVSDLLSSFCSNSTAAGCCNSTATGFC